MFRPVRLLLLLMIAFVAGIFHERNAQRELCRDSGGQVTPAGLCAVTGDDNG